MEWSGRALYGFTVEEAVGQHISIIVPPDHREELDEIMRKLNAGNRIQHRDTVRMSKDGKRINVSLQISPIRNSEGEVIGALKVARDITQRKRTEESLAFLRRPAKPWRRSRIARAHCNRLRG